MKIEKNNPSRDSLASSMSEQDEDQMLIEMQQKQHQRIIRNNFTLLIILNIISNIIFIFSFTFYMWYELQIVVQTVAPKEANSSGNSSSSNSGEDPAPSHTPTPQNASQQMNIWLNLLYVYNDAPNSQNYMTFEVYKDSNYFICNDVENKQFCVDQFDQMSMVGYVCFSLNAIAVILQVLDLYRLFKLRSSHGNRSGIKAFWLHPAIIGLYLAGFATYFFTVLYNELVYNEIIFDLKSFGVSFWTGIASIPIYIILSIYYRKTKNKLKSSELVDNLIFKINDFDKNQREKKKTGQGDISQLS